MRKCSKAAEGEGRLRQLELEDASKEQGDDGVEDVSSAGSKAIEVACSGGKMCMCLLSSTFAAFQSEAN